MNMDTTVLLLLLRVLILDTRSSSALLETIPLQIIDSLDPVVSFLVHTSMEKTNQASGSGTSVGTNSPQHHGLNLAPVMETIHKKITHNITDVLGEIHIHCLCQSLMGIPKIG